MNAIQAAKEIDRTILFADLVGYSRMMARDEPGTLEFIVSCSHLIDEVSRTLGGHLVQNNGDGFLILFEQTTDAIEFGDLLHRLIAKRQAGSVSPAQFRVGIHHGTVHQIDGMIHGHAVNLAARLEGQALPGTCVLSDVAYEHIRHSYLYPIEPIGHPPLKNIDDPVALYRTKVMDKPPLGTQSGLTVISVIGPLSITRDETVVQMSSPAKGIAMIGYLGLTSGGGESNRKMASLLWPGVAPKSAHKSFLACKRHVTKVLDTQFQGLVITGKDHIGLNELEFTSDIELILEDLRRDKVPALLTEMPNWPNAILAGLEGVSPVFAAWLTVTRDTWRIRVLKALADILDHAAPANAACRDAARAILVLEPGNELASAALITFHANRNDYVSAQAEFNRLKDHLATAHDLAPGGYVQDALARAKATANPSAHRPESNRSVVPARLLKIAVEPFGDQLGPNNHLVVGFRAELLSNLSRFREWSVVETKDSRSQASRAQAQGMSRAPNCHYAISAAYGEQDDPKLTLCLKDLSTGRDVWTDDIRLDLTEWASLHREIVARLSAQLDTYISADRLANMIGNTKYDVTSHDYWLQAEQVFSRWTPEAADEAEDILSKVLARDPAFAPAYSSLAGFHNVQHVIRPGSSRDSALGPSADHLVDRAVTLDPLDARNHLAVAWTAALNKGFDRASIHFDLAASLNPNGVVTLISCAMGYAFVGQPERAETLVSHVLKIAPTLSPYQWCYVASVHFVAGRYDDALAATRQSDDQIVDNQGWAAAALVRLGRIDEAKRAFEDLIDAVRPVWAGTTPPTAEAVFEWFVNAYPLRDDAVRQTLEDSLAVAMRGQ